MEVKSRHGCDVQVRFERTLDLVYRRLVRVVIIGQHSALPWSPLPHEFRPMSPKTKQAILCGVTRKDTAQNVRNQLDVAARGAGAALDDRESVIDRGLVPDKKRHQLVTVNKYTCLTSLRKYRPEQRTVQRQSVAVNRIFILACCPSW